jgi:hypothetical protein
VWWRWEIAGAPERARWAGARALCRVGRRVRDLLARGGGYRWIRRSCYRASVLCMCGCLTRVFARAWKVYCVCVVALRVCLRGRARCIVYVWLPYACVCAGVEGSHGARLPCSRVVSRVCACVCAHAYARACPRVKCAHVYVFQYVHVEFCLLA